MSFTLGEKSAIAQCKVYLLDRDIIRLRKEVDNVSDKHQKVKGKLIAQNEALGDEVSVLDTALSGIESKEESLREGLDLLSHSIMELQRNNDPAFEEESNRRTALWETLEELINSRNSERKKMDTLKRTVSVISTLATHGDKTVPASDITSLENYLRMTATQLVGYRNKQSEIQEKLADALLDREEARNAREQAIDAQNQQSSSGKKRLDELEYTEDTFQQVLVSLCREIRESGLIRDRKHRYRNYPLCFVGAELVTWILRANIVQTRDEACIIGDQLLKRGFVYRVTKGDGFEDAFEFFRFRCDDSVIRKVSKSGWLWKKNTWRFCVRYFVWDMEQRQLCLYRSKKDPTPDFIYTISEGSEILASDNDIDLAKNRFCFEIRFPIETILLAARSDRERKEWIRALWLGRCSCGSAKHDENCKFNPRKQKKPKKFCILRTKNNLELTNIFSKVKMTEHPAFNNVGKFLLKNEHNRRRISNHLLEIFEDTSNPVGKLFNEFSRLFTSTFRGMESLDNKAELDAILEDAVQDVQSFLNNIHKLLINSIGNDARQSASVCTACEEAIASHLFSVTIFNALFPIYQKRYEAQDAHLWERLGDGLRETTARDFGVVEELCLEPDKDGNHPYQIAIDKLNKLKDYMTPQDKLECVVDVSELICKCVDIFKSAKRSERKADEALEALSGTPKKKRKKSEGAMIGADDLLLIFALVICNANNLKLHAQIKFMEDYITERQSQMMCGYYLTTLQAATQLLTECDVDEIRQKHSDDEDEIPTKMLPGDQSPVVSPVISPNVDFDRNSSEQSTTSDSTNSQSVANEP